jgi:hypothetical protein
MIRALIPAVLLAGCMNRTGGEGIGRGFSGDPLLYTDKSTGCQYLSDGRGLTPRISAAGKTHMGCKAVQP